MADGTQTDIALPHRWPRDLKSCGWTRMIARELGVSAPAADDPIFDAMRHALTLEDRLADDLAGWIKEDSSANRALFNRVLDEGSETLAPLPPPLAQFVGAIVDRRPEWADVDKIRLGCETHLRLGSMGRLASGTLGLLEGYRSASVAKSLVTTGSLVTSSGRRLAETAKFMTEVVTSDAMDRFSDGFKAAAKVRLVHSFVRHGLSRSPHWKPDLWGMPITILDSLGTALAFWVPVVRAAPVFGYNISREEAEGMMILWNYVGWIQGVPEKLLPRTLDETYRLYVAIMMQVGQPDDDSKKLAHAYMSVAEQKGDKTSWLQGKMVHGAAAALISKLHLNELGLRGTIFRHWPALMRPAVKAREKRRLRDPAFHAALIAKGREEASMDLPEDLKRHHTYDPKTVIRDQSALQA